LNNNKRGRNQFHKHSHQQEGKQISGNRLDIHASKHVSGSRLKIHAQERKQDSGAVL